MTGFWFCNEALRFEIKKDEPKIHFDWGQTWSDACLQWPQVILPHYSVYYICTRGVSGKKLLAQDMTEIWSFVIVVWASPTTLEYRSMDESLPSLSSCKGAPEWPLFPPVTWALVCLWSKDSWLMQSHCPSPHEHLHWSAPSRKINLYCSRVAAPLVLGRYSPGENAEGRNSPLEPPSHLVNSLSQGSVQPNTLP